MALVINLEDISKEYEIQGYINGEFAPFMRDMRVEGFLIKKKKL